MVRKGSKQVAIYNNLTDEDVSSIVLAATGSVKDKQVDPRKLVGAIHIKKYLADAKINGKVESWISVIKRITADPEEGQPKYEATSHDLELLEQCKAETQAYLDTKASEALKAKVGGESQDEYKNLKDISSSMKYKFSRSAYEVVTHVINLMVREILVFTCNNCAAQGSKLTKVSHIPWADIQTKLLSGLYMNTKATFDVLHPVDDVEEEEETVEEVEEETTEEVEETEEDLESDEASPAPVEETKSTKPRLSQYISNTFKELTSRDERFKGLLLGKEVTAIIDRIIYQVLDRYANVIKSLLETATSKTVNGRIAVIATAILLQDHVHAVADDVNVVLNVVQKRMDELEIAAKVKEEEKKKKKEGEAASPIPAEAEPVKKAKKVKA